MRITERDNMVFATGWRARGTWQRPGQHAMDLGDLLGRAEIDRVRVVQVRGEGEEEGQLWSLYRVSGALRMREMDGDDASEGSEGNHADGNGPIIHFLGPDRGVITIRDIDSGEMVGFRKLPSWAAAQEYFDSELHAQEGDMALARTITNLKAEIDALNRLLEDAPDLWDE